MSYIEILLSVHVSFSVLYVTVMLTRDFARATMEHNMITLRENADQANRERSEWQSVALRLEREITELRAKPTPSDRGTG